MHNARCTYGAYSADAEVAGSNAVMWQKECRHLKVSVIGGAYEILIRNAIQVHSCLKKLLKFGKVLLVMGSLQLVCISA